MLVYTHARTYRHIKYKIPKWFPLIRHSPPFTLAYLRNPSPLRVRSLNPFTL